MLIGIRIRTAQGKEAFKRGLLFQTKKYNKVWKKARMGTVLIRYQKKQNDVAGRKPQPTEMNKYQYDDGMYV